MLKENACCKMCIDLDPPEEAELISIYAASTNASYLDSNGWGRKFNRIFSPCQIDHL